jgi:hypothetical protein
MFHDIIYYIRNKDSKVLMPIEIHWANIAQSILIEKFKDVWTWQQVSEACETQIRSLVRDKLHPIIIVQDMVGSHWTPTTSLLQDVQNSLATSGSDNIVMTLVVSGNPSIDALLVSAYKRSGQKDVIYQRCSTVNQALQVADDYLKTQS